MNEGESGPHVPLPGQQCTREAGGGAGGLEAEDGEESRAGCRVPELATHRQQRAQKLLSLLLNLIRQTLQDHFAYLIKVIQLILGGSRSMFATGPASPLVLSGQSQGLTHLLVVLHLLQLVYKVGNLDHLDRILMVHVSAQEIHFLLDHLDLVIQLLHLLLQVWRSQGEQEAGSSLKDPSQDSRRQSSPWPTGWVLG